MQIKAVASALAIASLAAAAVPTTGTANVKNTGMCLHPARLALSCVFISFALSLVIIHISDGPLFYFAMASKAPFSLSPTGMQQHLFVECRDRSIVRSPLHLLVAMDMGTDIDVGHANNKWPYNKTAFVLSTSLFPVFSLSLCPHSTNKHNCTQLHTFARICTQQA